MVVAALDGATSPAVVDKRVDSLLEHPFLVADDDVGCLKFDKVLQAVVPVDYPAVEVVKVACGKSATIELNHRVQFGGQNRQDGQYHPFGLVAALSEGLDHPQPLDCLLAALARCVADLIL